MTTVTEELARLAEAGDVTALATLRSAGEPLPEAAPQPSIAASVAASVARLPQPRIVHEAES